MGAQSEADLLVAHHREPLKRFFERRLRNRADAEDLTPEVLERLARRRLLIRAARSNTPRPRTDTGVVANPKKTRL